MLTEIQRKVHEIRYCVQEVDALRIALGSSGLRALSLVCYGFQDIVAENLRSFYINTSRYCSDVNHHLTRSMYDVEVLEIELDSNTPQHLIDSCITDITTHLIYIKKLIITFRLYTTTTTNHINTIVAFIFMKCNRLVTLILQPIVSEILHSKIDISNTFQVLTSCQNLTSFYIANNDHSRFCVEEKYILQLINSCDKLIDVPFHTESSIRLLLNTNRSNKIKSIHTVLNIPINTNAYAYNMNLDGVNLEEFHAPLDFFINSKFQYLKKYTVFPKNNYKDLCSRSDYKNLIYILTNAIKLEELTLVDFNIYLMSTDIYTPLNNLHKLRKLTLKNCHFYSSSVFTKILQKLPPSVECIRIIDISEYTVTNINCTSSLKVREFIYKGLVVFSYHEAKLVYSFLKLHYLTLETLRLELIPPLLLKSFLNNKVLNIKKSDVYPLFLCKNLRVLDINIGNEINEVDYNILIDHNYLLPRIPLNLFNFYVIQKQNYDFFLNKIISSGGYPLLESLTLTCIHISDWPTLSDLLDVLPNLTFFRVKHIRGYMGITMGQDSFMNKCRSRYITMRIPV